jgi:hypothetical protein
MKPDGPVYDFQLSSFCFLLSPAPADLAVSTAA